MVARFCLLVLQATLLTTVFLIPSEAATILVPSQQPTIQDGISAAVAGDTVLIAPGIHLGTGNRDINFLGKDVIVMSEEGSQSTTVDCEALGRGFMLIDGESAAATLRGLAIVNGVAPFGAGVLCVGSSPTIVDCVFRDNVATEMGGGSCCVWSGAALDSCRFIDNTAREEIASGDGGGVYCENSNLTLTACSFISNFVGGYGGGLYSHGARVDFQDCLFQANSPSDGQGGGMAAFASSTGNASDCTFIDNTAPDGGGVVCRESSRTFYGCRFKDNWAEGAFGCSGGAVHGNFESWLSFYDCLLDRTRSLPPATTQRRSTAPRGAAWIFAVAISMAMREETGLVALLAFMASRATSRRAPSSATRLTETSVWQTPRRARRTRARAGAV
jgi:predicted outer membrane repeat protein